MSGLYDSKKLIALHGHDRGDITPPDDCPLCGIDLTGARTCLWQARLYTVCPSCGSHLEGEQKEGEQ